MANDWREQKKSDALIKNIITLVAGAILAWAAWSNALGSVTMGRQPDLSLGTVGLGDYPAARLAESQMIRNPSGFNAKAIAGLARDSLRAQSLNSTALRLLALEPKPSIGVEKSEALLFVSNSVSRRDVATQLALVQLYVSKEDAPHTIYHYDSALRVSNDVEPVLFPILADALEGSNIQQALVPSIRSFPRWLPGFIRYTVGSGKNAANLATALMVAGGLPKEPELCRDLETQILGALATGKDFETLRTFYLSLHGADAGIFKTTEFTRVNTDSRFLPLTWQTFASTTISSTFEGDANARQQQLDVQISSGERAIAARKLLFLNLGQRLVTVSYKFLDSGKDASATLALECLNADSVSTVWQFNLKAVPGAQTQSGLVKIPEKCVTQYMAVNVAGGSAPDGMHLLVSGLSLN